MTKTTAKPLRKRNKNRAATAALCFSVAVFPAFAAMEKSRPMSEMEGGCENFAMPLANEMALWEKSEIRIQGAQDDKSTTELPSNKKISLTLYPQKKVVLPAKPEKDFTKGQAAYAGLAKMEVKKDGLYRVALGSKVWLDVIEVEAGDGAPPRVLPPSHFEMQTGCQKIFKAVEYNLKAGKKYLLQISSSSAPAASLLTRFVK